MKQFSTSQAVEVLKKGGVVVYPTETAYGLGANATCEAAVEQIFELKGRKKTKSVLLLMSDIKMVRRYAHINKEEAALIKKYWPGALTLVLNAKKYSFLHLAKEAVAKDGTIAVRISSHPVAQALCRALGKPLVSTSANRAGGANTYSVAGVKKQLGTRLRVVKVPYYIYDVGKLLRNKVSTIARVRNGKVNILRQGLVFSK